MATPKSDLASSHQKHNTAFSKAKGSLAVSQLPAFQGEASSITALSKAQVFLS